MHAPPIALLLILLLGSCAASSMATPRVAPANGPSQAQSIPTPLGSVSAKNLSGAALEPREPIALLIQSRQSKLLAGRLADHGSIVAQSEAGLEVRWDYLGRPSLQAVEPRHLESSFVVDYDEPTVRRLAERVVNRFGAKPSAKDLTTFVSEHIQTSEYGNFEIASRVASRGAGDCTEHAVLLAALARSFGIPARLAFGYVLIPEHGLALGHAWSELHDGQHWVPHDAALNEPVDNRYLVVNHMQDETIRYRLSTLDMLMDLRAIVILERAAPTK